ncbi:hypothetical protein PFAG_01961 [Plasmodium falciparum Santa Lucia]|uniref:Coenzyme Q-binding protein COQ10 homolog, mitochondrial n=5 Tax=Plasmodium falciparum TaxID=5833 RepID=C0H4S7_PLAF7|nr:coenzyme Q-binding protein COQ10 homolog, mitochondrial [Plasmodium falciparum 3D7]ETW52591.1 hypothetical protein PFUGPA_05597 [Plasmodium falciparum Palo Alto/Uganda]ETW62181.1 hypothetical protein PFMC_01971 [Plasmodium falciparum CAMP/Malaysia]EUT87637.1 hypothetical protein PFAG_01961 [Plasmodium falciparum Santa Lucia]KAF4330437.1 coenzyme Q-binding protein COQ10-like [Plasmodium falciparum NF54]SOS77970.1 conserved Plasmodium protein, unknown function [Plasmodium sp. gorilla clade G1|eukprot:XP_002808826.1 conserved Plasmodium protein, unknown function [Plasmodium falciparum 3D7]
MKINILKKGKKFYITNNHFNYDIKRNFTIFQNSFIKTNDIVYRKNIDIVCAKDLFFYTILNVDRYKYFLPYVTDSKITEKNKEYFKANLQIENIFFKEKYDSLIQFIYPTTITVSSEDTNIFHHLITEWIIKEKKNCINIDFYINFRLKNKIYQNFMNLYIKELGKKILYSFINESKSNSYKNTDVLHLIK